MLQFILLLTDQYKFFCQMLFSLVIDFLVMGRVKDPVWKHYHRGEDNKSVLCNFYDKIFKFSKVNKINQKFINIIYIL
jgi:hypothetical protein